MDPESDSFYTGALARISRVMVVLGIAFSVAALLRCGWRIALGFACGAVIAYLNFHWLKQGVESFSEGVVRAGPRSAKGIVLRFLARYALLAVGAYAIFRFSPASLYGLFAGLSLPVAAIGCEAAYEAYAALMRGI
ncbi:MAG TPA: ATP synthase subunit I [Terriglobales bacterium]|nr:ATP synthase subunit I [Terriglobales bacterium]